MTAILYAICGGVLALSVYRLVRDAVGWFVTKARVPRVRIPANRQACEFLEYQGEHTYLLRVWDRGSFSHAENAIESWERNRRLNFGAANAQAMVEAVVLVWDLANDLAREAAGK